jgi:hypothetical protein
VIEKLDVVKLSTVPDAPPEAGPDRALDPPPPAVTEGDVAVAEGDVAQAAESPITAHISAAATIRPLLLFDINRRTFGRCSFSAMVTEADESGEDAGGEGGATPPPPEFPATGAPDVVLETGRAGRVSWGPVGS